jgi:hypothetical protein
MLLPSKETTLEGIIVVSDDQGGVGFHSGSGTPKSTAIQTALRSEILLSLSTTSIASPFHAAKFIA